MNPLARRLRSRALLGATLALLSIASRADAADRDAAHELAPDGRHGTMTGHVPDGHHGAPGEHAPDGHRDGHRGTITPSDTAGVAPARASVPTLSGQYAFATVAEIVAILEADPATDWTRVDIEALRRHLIDMDRVTMDARVVREDTAGGARFQVGSADPEVRDSVRRMATAHAAMMATGADVDPSEPARAWQYRVVDAPDGVVMTVTGRSPADAVRIRALGFTGLMASGTHHRRHHLALASGHDPH